MQGRKPRFQTANVGREGARSITHTVSPFLVFVGLLSVSLIGCEPDSCSYSPLLHTVIATCRMLTYGTHVRSSRACWYSRTFGDLHCEWRSRNEELGSTPTFLLRTDSEVCGKVSHIGVLLQRFPHSKRRRTSSQFFRCISLSLLYPCCCPCSLVAESFKSNETTIY